MNKYSQEIDINDSETTQAKLINLTGKNKHVLEFGCANGRMSKYLKENSCKVTGVEIDKQSAEAAKTFCEKVIVGDIEDGSSLKQIKIKYDVIIFGDVLEHLKDPKSALSSVSDLLDKKGYILVSLPNFAYFTVRKDIMMGKFEYNEKGGIVDTGHIRFFTLATAKKMFTDCGYKIASFDVLSVPRFKKFPPLYNFLKILPSFFGYEFIFKLTPIGEVR